MKRMAAVVRAVVLAAIAACGRQDAAKAAQDSASPSADSVTAAAIAAAPGATSTNPAPPTRGAPAPSTSRSGAGSTGGATPGGGTRPHLTKLTPSSGSNAGGAIILVEIKGDRLTPTNNTVYFGSIRLEGLATTADGGSLKFTVPETIPSRGEAPPMTIQPGTYPVYVVNSNGTSDTLVFALRNQ